MNPQKIAGIVAAVSGAAVLILGVVGGVSSASTFSLTPGGLTNSMGAQFMGGSGMMGSSGMGPGMMGSGHMGLGGATTPSTQSAAIPGAPEVRVSATEFALSPAEIVLPAGSAVNLTLENKGALPHDLTIPGLGVRLVAAAGQTQTVGLRNLAAGTSAAYCSVSGHAAAGMRATVIVR
ncbi:MAG TPA: cupredoxin domain-containing protein [Candidatus Limnocylindria bacterium]|nr:cupredoxin domain-containing protein [Candidatus Limnocylindria bacterium]